jgi:hypothetical protein
VNMGPVWPGFLVQVRGKGTGVLWWVGGCERSMRPPARSSSPPPPPPPPTHRAHVGLPCRGNRCCSAGTLSDCQVCTSSGDCLAQPNTGIVMSQLCGTTVTVEPSSSLFLRLQPTGALYPNGLSCTLAVVSTGGQPLVFTMLSVDTEQCCDRVVVYDGPTTSAPQLLTAAGKLTPAGARTARSGTLLLVFSSDSSVQASGFSAVVGAAPVSGAPCALDSQCPGSVCRGGQCCLPGSTPLCTACGATGACSACPPGMSVSSGGCVSQAGGLCAADQVCADCRGGGGM